MDKKTQINIWYVALAIMGILLFQNGWRASGQIVVIPYGELEALLEQDQVAEVYIRQDRLEGKLKAALQDGRRYFVATRASPALAERLTTHKVTIRGVMESTFFARPPVLGPAGAVLLRPVDVLRAAHGGKAGFCRADECGQEQGGPLHHVHRRAGRGRAAVIGNRDPAGVGYAGRGATPFGRDETAGCQRSRLERMLFNIAIFRFPFP